MARTKFNYRHFYMDFYGIVRCDGLDIHHIDNDSNNNGIENLIMIPSELHNKYHLYKEIVLWCDLRDMTNISVPFYQNARYQYTKEHLDKMAGVMYELQPYICFKTFLETVFGVKSHPVIWKEQDIISFLNRGEIEITKGTKEKLMNYRNNQWGF